MPAFIDDYSYFLGDGSCNKDGLSLDEFLERYNAFSYDRPSVTADILVFAHDGIINDPFNNLSLLMVKRSNHPSIGYWALPGGFCEIHEDFIQSARRELYEETGLTDIPMELINTFGEEKRDPRYRLLTGAFLALVDRTKYTPVAGDDAADARWFSVGCEEVSSEIIDREMQTADNKADSTEKNINSRSGKVKRTVYRLSLTSMDADRIICGAVVAVTENLNSILKETSYEISENNYIAFDHARFIVNGLLHIRQRMREVSSEN